MALVRAIPFGVAVPLVLALTGGAGAHPIDLTPLPPEPDHARELTTPLCVAETAMPIALVGLGALDGGRAGRALMMGGFASSFDMPSSGELYDGRVFSLGMGARAVGVSMMAYDGPNRDDSLFLGGTALTLAGALYDVATSPDSVRRWNRDHGVRIELTPAAVPVRRGVGLGLFGRF